MLRNSCVGLVVLLFLAGFVLADTLEGTVKKVDTAKGCFVVTDKDKKDSLIDLAKDAKVTVDGKAAKLADLKDGQKVKVTHEKNKASVVDASSK